MGTEAALIVLSLLFAASLFCTVHCIMHRGKTGKFIPIIITVDLMTVLYCFVLLFSKGKLYLPAYVAYSMLAGWLGWFILRFYATYLSCTKKTLRMIYCLLPIIVADNVIVFYNCFIAKDSYGIQLMDGNYYYINQQFVFASIHSAICLIPPILSFFLILRRLYYCNRFDSFRYASLLFYSGGLFVLEIAVLFMIIPWDASPVICNSAAWLIYYSAFVHVEKGFLQHALSMVPKEMDEFLIVLDSKDECIYMNPRAKEFFAKMNLNQNESQKKILEWKKKAETSPAKDDNVITVHYGDTTGYFRIFHNVFMDTRKKIRKERQYMGCFLILLDRTEEFLHIEKEHYIATMDQLTGIYNMHTFEEKVDRILTEFPDKHYVMICSDVKEFKLINELFGKLAGDMLLINIAEKLRISAKQDWIYCRVTGDRFAVFMERDSFQEEKFLALYHSLEKLEEDENYNVHFYVGVYEVTDNEIPVSVMCDRANRAIHSVKGSFQKLAYYGEEMQKNAEEEQLLINALPSAMENGGICLFLQPQTDQEGKLLGAEALVRWQHPERGLLSPAAFIPLFEENGMISILDMHVWRMACETLKKWEDRGWGDMTISINISPVDIYFMDVYRILTELVEEFELAPSRLRLEITETAVARNPEEQMRLINNLKAYGFCVEMDDFGSGYSSLNMLKDLNIDIIKIDLAFLKKTENVKRAKTILKKIVELSTEIGMGVIVEGVETEEQKEFLLGIGCDTFQGYYFARPMSVFDFEKKYSA